MGTTVASRKGRNANTGTDWLRNQSRRISGGEELPVDPHTAASVEIEAWLQSHGVRYAPPADIPMALIDEKRSRQNQARRDAIVADSVERYSASMRTGERFPPIVCYPDDGRLVIIDGNNRQAAARRVGADSVWGIVVAEDTPSEVIQLLTVSANARHGVTPETSWRIQQAFGLCAMGYSDEQAAEEAGLSVAQLRSARTVQNVDQRARGMRVPGFLDLPASAKIALSSVRDQRVFYNLGKLAASTTMTTDDIREVTRVLRGLPSEEERLQYVESVSQVRSRQPVVRAPRGKHSRLHSPKVAFLAGAGKIRAVDPAALVQQIVTSADRDSLRETIQETKRKIALIEVALHTLEGLEGE